MSARRMSTVFRELSLTCSAVAATLEEQEVRLDILEEQVLSIYDLLDKFQKDFVRPLVSADGRTKCYGDGPEIGFGPQ